MQTIVTKSWIIILPFTKKLPCLNSFDYHNSSIVDTIYIILADSKGQPPEPKVLDQNWNYPHTTWEK